MNISYFVKQQEENLKLFKLIEQHYPSSYYDSEWDGEWWIAIDKYRIYWYGGSFYLRDQQWDRVHEEEYITSERLIELLKELVK